ncbi:PTS sugar transporter subunit IIC (plasmid) [Cetobacterium somerae]|uniref:PTS sugar transporter subunit IIC n=1 Tax=Cetobacterium somerae TaxID=188913 RepID=UPI003D7690DD
MDFIIKIIEKRMMPIANKLASNNELNAIRHAMMSMASFFMVGSLFLLLAYIPVKGYDEFLNKTFGNGVFQSLMTSVSGATLNLMGLIVLIAVAYNYAVIKQTDVPYPIVSSLMVFLILTPKNSNGIPTEWLGAKGMFIAIIISLVTTNLYIKLKKLGVAPKMPDNVPPAVLKTFASVFPITVIALISIIIKASFLTTAYEHIHNFVFSIVQTPLLKLGNNIFSLIISEIIGQLLWFFGLQGNDIIGSVMSPIWMIQTTANLEAFTAGLPLPNIITGIFRNVYMLIGGSGNTLPLTLSMVFFCKSKQLKTLGLLALPASIFNINEPIIFGLPIVLNAIMFIPWVLATPIAAIIGYSLMKIGLVSATNGILIPWTTPVFLSGYLVSGVSGIILQGIILITCFLVYFPFLRAMDLQILKKEAEKLKQKDEELDEIDLSDVTF